MKPLSFRTFVNALVILVTKWYVGAVSVKTPVQIRIGARPSTLAQIQAMAVSDALEVWDDVETTVFKIEASGDHTGRVVGSQMLPLAVSAVDFTGSLDDALLSGEIDVAVHSLKDIPPTDRWRGKGNLYIACHLPREDPRDVLVGPYSSIHDLPPQAKVGTSSIRRQAQLLSIRPDLELINVRGNVETRLTALNDGTVDALILAQAGLNRLKKETLVSATPIPFDELLPGANQGIVAAVCRIDDIVTRDWLLRIDNEDASVAATVERAFLDTVDSFRPARHGESVAWTGRPPLAALMEKVGTDQWLFRALLARPDGSKVIRHRQVLSQTLSLEDLERLGRKTGEEIIEEAGPGFYGVGS